jgi:hypothetical protein
LSASSGSAVGAAAGWPAMAMMPSGASFSAITYRACSALSVRPRSPLTSSVIVASLRVPSI